MIGVSMDENIENRFKGLIAVGLAGIAFIPMLLGVYDIKTKIIFYSLPLLS